MRGQHWFAGVLAVAGFAVGCNDCATDGVAVPEGGRGRVARLECAELMDAGLEVGQAVDMQTFVERADDVSWVLCEGVELSSASTSFAITVGTEDAMAAYLDEQVCAGCREVDVLRLCEVSLGGRFMVRSVTPSAIELDVPVKLSGMFHARIGGTTGTYRGPNGELYEREECR